MEGVKTAWRNAACLLFFTGPVKYSLQSASSVRHSLEAYKSGRSLQPPITNFLKLTSEPRDDMEMVFVQRHSKSGFMVGIDVKVPD